MQSDFAFYNSKYPNPNINTLHYELCNKYTFSIHLSISTEMAMKWKQQLNFMFHRLS